MFIAVVVLLAFLLLMTVFRSLLIPLVGLGHEPAVDRRRPRRPERGLQLGLGQLALGLNGTGPIDAFIPVLMFSVLFGLSMDYEVYLVSRIQEEWHQLHHTTDIHRRPPGPRSRAPSAATQPPGDHHRPGQERPHHRRRGR
jgi:RND superfamily putative drug exporter